MIPWIIEQPVLVSLDLGILSDGCIPTMMFSTIVTPWVSSHVIGTLNPLNLKMNVMINKERHLECYCFPFLQACRVISLKREFPTIPVKPLEEMNLVNNHASAAPMNSFKWCHSSSVLQSFPGYLQRSPYTSNHKAHDICENPKSHYNLLCSSVNTFTSLITGS